MGKNSKGRWNTVLPTPESFHWVKAMTIITNQTPTHFLKRWTTFCNFCAMMILRPPPSIFECTGSTTMNEPNSGRCTVQSAQGTSCLKWRTCFFDCEWCNSWQWKGKKMWDKARQAYTDICMNNWEVDGHLNEIMEPCSTRNSTRKATSGHPCFISAKEREKNGVDRFEDCLHKMRR